MAVVSSPEPAGGAGQHLGRRFRDNGLIASRPKDCRFHQPFLNELLAPYGITPRIVESPHSCSVQFAYAAAGEGIAIAGASMSACVFSRRGDAALRRAAAAVTAGHVCARSHERLAMKIFRQVVLECARTTLPDVKPSAQAAAATAAASCVRAEARGQLTRAR